MIEVNYIATGGYIQYLDLFLETLSYFFPKDKKKLRIITNCDINIDERYIEIYNIEVIKILDLIYPCINLNKTYILSQLPRTDSKYIFYFDADTYFNEMDDTFWVYLKNSMDNDEFSISTHPYYNLDDNDKFKQRDIEIFFSAMTERDETQGSYIDSYYYTYIISSFFCAKREVFFDVCEKVTQMIRNNMTRDNHYRIPLYMDENYFNKLVYDFEYKGAKDFIFNVQDFILLGNSINKENTLLSFITQKNYNKDFKINRR